MIWKRIRRYITLSLVCAILVAVGFSEWAVSAAAPGWLRMVYFEIQAACRDAGTQWMVVVCLLSYLNVFLFLERRILPQKNTENTKQITAPPTPGFRPLTSISAFLAFFRGKNSDVWLLCFVAIVLLRYAFDYTNAARSLQVVVLLTGIVIGKGFAFYANRRVAIGDRREEVRRGSPLPAVGGARVPASQLVSSLAPPEETGTQGLTRPTMILGIIVFLLACASLYQPERGMEFQYRGQRRWTGVWDNPNTYGVLMGVGLTLAVGLLAQFNAKAQRGKGASRKDEKLGRVTPCAPGTDGAEPSTCNFQPATVPKLSCSSCVSWLKRIWFPLLLIGAGGLCGFGLLKSYSRGAWLGTAVGIGFLIWKWINRTHLTPSLSPVEAERVTGAHGVTRPTIQISRIWRISRLRGNLFPSSILLFSILIISFWQFRHTESPLLRRVFSMGNPNDFSWRNRVTAWQGAGRMMWDKPLTGFGWGKAEEIYSKEYRAARLEESAAVQLNDYLMIGISAGVPALICLIAYLWLVLGRRQVGRGSPLPAALVADTDGAHGVTRPTINFQPSTPKEAESRHLTPALSPFEAERESELSTIHSQLSTTAAAGVAVLLIGFWFDGGLFKLPTCVVFWVLLELCRRRGDEAHADEGRARHSVRAVDMESGAQRTARLTIALRWLAGLFAVGAFGLTVLHLGTPQMAVSERTLNIARKFLVPSKEKIDFEYLAAKPIWSNTPLKTLLQHAHLANYNRTLVNWKLEDDLYREFVLSPVIQAGKHSKSNTTESRHLTPSLSPVEAERVSEPSTINPQPSTTHAWRRPPWEFFYPRIRKESSLEAAAEIVVRHLRERVTISEDGDYSVDIQSIWQRQITSVAGFERIYVAAMRSAGIPARLTTSGQAEFWNGAEWKPAPLPVKSTQEK